MDRLTAAGTGEQRHPDRDPSRDNLGTGPSTFPCSTIQGTLGSTSLGAEGDS